jgi:hypothetical protein
LSDIPIGSLSESEDNKLSNDMLSENEEMKDETKIPKAS